MIGREIMITQSQHWVNVDPV
ncbi:hypothetical protein A2U01_0077214, partial [Trifolium medium]|nr:hypothetical protein [Trifolium medium]